MELIFLGTSSGVPTKTRNVYSFAFKYINSKSWYMVDCGEGTQHQLLKTNLSLNNLSAVFITHVHGDHLYGLPGLLASATMYGREEPLKIIGPNAVKEYIESTKELTQTRFSYEIEFINIEEKNKLEVNDFHVDIVTLSHRVPSFGFCFTEKKITQKLDVKKLEKNGIPKGPLWGKIQSGENIFVNGKQLKSSEYLLKRREPRKVIVAGDNDNPLLLKNHINSLDVLVHEATYTNDIAEDKGDIPQHCSAKKIASFSKDNSIPNLILTHFSPRYQEEDKGNGLKIDDIKDEGLMNYNGNLILANDFDRFVLNAKGEVVKI